mmetsp:Transcript_41680/g.116127  ORF Transcript_41680/g.116127 Transcript_41680/m.116127 type:complete len:216 (-) Transcript_41680:172-819(-)
MVLKALPHPGDGPAAALLRNFAERRHRCLPHVSGRVLKARDQGRDRFGVAPPRNLPQRLHRGKAHVVVGAPQARDHRGHGAAVGLPADEAQDLDGRFPNVLRAILEGGGGHGAAVVTNEPPLSEALQRLRLLRLAATLQAAASQVERHQDIHPEDFAIARMMRREQLVVAQHPRVEDEDLEKHRHVEPVGNLLLQCQDLRLRLHDQLKAHVAAQA